MAGWEPSVLVGAMHIDPRVFLSRPQDLPLEKAVSLSEALGAAAAGADKVVILSAYYGTDYLKSAFAELPKKSRRACDLTLVFGLDTNARLPHAVEELRKLRMELVKLGFRSPSIRLFNKDAPFHSKLYYFKRATKPIWFVGSANASPAIAGARHELMIRLSGRHDQLSEYVKCVVERSVVVEEVTRPTLVVSDLRSFLLNGALCYRPLSRLSFTFEACQINSDHRAVLKRSLAAASEVPHADPQTEGFGFSLANAVAQVTGQQFADLAAADAEVGQSVSRLKFRHLAVETIYGYWLPSAYADEVKQKLRQIEQKSVAAMRRFASKLEEASFEALECELDRHVVGLKEFFAKHSVKIKPKSDYKAKFKDFVRARKSWLADEHRLERVVRRLHVEQMPDIWGDEDATRKFEDSFFEDLALRFDTPRKSWIVGVLREELNLTEGSEPEQLRLALEGRLKAGFGDSIWWGEQDEEELEEQ
jgi:hypothetical protein